MEIAEGNFRVKHRAVETETLYLKGSAIQFDIDLPGGGWEFAGSLASNLHCLIIRTPVKLVNWLVNASIALVFRCKMSVRERETASWGWW